MQGLIILAIALASLILILAIGGVVNSKNSYVCPNCGESFMKKWYGLMFKSGPMVKNGNGELRLKCPSCKKTDFCLHSKQNHS